ncbi:thioredoxin family protein [Halobacillus salinarum]|uniref:Thioredoxin family protein n=1 Tax=Halobacillus salinarum TaxID=2932257 RepID=A0ABY4ENT4_9BACI|nr:thioredoxin family protein [Halobacillus salinarum]UOQ46118.1 thioredoxin family protein [Halobacillus salinarum]
MLTLISDDQFTSLKNEPNTMFLFSAEWCPDCRFIEPFVPSIEEQFQNWTFVYVDRDQFIHICAEYDIFGIPSFLAFKNGDEAGRFVSKNRKSKEEIEAFIKELENN